MADEERTRYESVALIIEKIMAFAPLTSGWTCLRGPMAGTPPVQAQRLMAAKTGCYMAVPEEASYQVLSRLLKDIAERLP